MLAALVTLHNQPLVDTLEHKQLYKQNSAEKKIKTLLATPK